MNELVLLRSTSFNNVELDCYVEPTQQDKGDFWATREQIGRLLEYENPEISIANIHNRHSERLCKFSTLTKLIRVEGGREVAREVTVYNFKGLLEICRYSNQPKANAVMDWLWEVADEIRKTGSYSTKPSDEEDRELRRKELDDNRIALNLEGAKILQRMIDAPAVPLSDESKAVIQHEVFKLVTGGECLAMLPPVSEKYYTATELGSIFGVSSKKIGKIAKAHGLKSPEGEGSQFGKWVLSKSPYSAHQCSTFIYNNDARDWFTDHKDLLF